MNKGCFPRIPEKPQNPAYLKYEHLTQDKQQVNANFSVFLKLTGEPYECKKGMPGACLDIQ